MNTGVSETGATVSRYVRLPARVDARVGELVRRGEFLSVSEALRAFAVAALAQRDFKEVK
jgi:Arc/MetJ-type ribon-helix-helix transcriptional regulator